MHIEFHKRKMFWNMLLFERYCDVMNYIIRVIHICNFCTIHLTESQSNLDAKTLTRLQIHRRHWFGQRAFKTFHRVAATISDRLFLLSTQFYS